ncbi:putative ORFan [Tupanvirus deep ocean]|uniref:ORFan n=2 Tax=Tupanvirus TaxID=2094720 RepID=A0AC62A9R5_9VIRU|nr:putative ORFan [Tupanvirus deep ocean]QKU34464.1 putative ORFan [Tupanvirus deep ocean]
MTTTGTPISVEQCLANTKTNTVRRMNELGLDHDNFMAELSKYGGVIAGSFMLMNFAHDGSTDLNFFGKPQECGDIDVYICDNEYFKNMYSCEPGAEPCVFHPFELYIKKHITQRYRMKNSYFFIDGMLYSRIYLTKKININFILLREPCVPYINNNFDLDCCKIIYDGQNIMVYQIDNLIQGKSLARYNKCYLDHIYQDKPVYWTKPPRRNFYVYKNDVMTLKNSLPFIKFKILYDVYMHVGGLVENTSYPTYTHNEAIIRCSDEPFNFIEKKYSALDNLDLYTYFMLEINKIVDLDKLFSRLNESVDREDCSLSGSVFQDWDTLQLDDTMVKVISMIRTLERIEKYKSRGITEITLVN